MSGVELVKVKSQDDGMRLNRWFLKYYPGLSLGRLNKLLRTKQIKVDGQRAEAVAIDRDAGIAECHCFHSFPVLSKYTYPKISFGLYSVSAVISW